MVYKKALLTSCVVFGSIMAGQQPLSQQDRMLPLEQRMDVLTSTSSNFDESLALYFPSLTQIPDFPSIRKGVVVLHNNAPYAIKAVVIKWTIVEGGITTTLFRPMMPEPRRFGGVPGAMPLIAPNQAIIVSPYAQLSEPSTSTEQQQFIENTTAVDKHISDASSTIAAQIDSLIIGNGAGNAVIFGRDNYGMQLKFTAERDASIEEAKALLPLIESGSGVLGYLDNQLKGSATQLDDPNALALAHAAVRLKALYQKVSIDEFKRQVTILSGANRMIVTKSKDYIAGRG